MRTPHDVGPSLARTTPLGVGGFRGTSLAALALHKDKEGMHEQRQSPDWLEQHAHEHRATNTHTHTQPRTRTHVLASGLSTAPRAVGGPSTTPPRTRTAPQLEGPLACHSNMWQWQWEGLLQQPRDVGPLAMPHAAGRLEGTCANATRCGPITRTTPLARCGRLSRDFTALHKEGMHEQGQATDWLEQHAHEHRRTHTHARTHTHD